MNNTPKQFARFISPTPKCEIVTLTQPLVDWLLSINTSNRKIRPSIVKSYAEDIKRGEWDVTSQGVGISRDGVLLDGQHRLLALKECGYPPTRSVLVWGLKKEAQMKVDTGAKRSVTNIISLALQVTADTTITSAIRYIALAEYGYPTKYRVPICDLVSIYEDFEGIIKQIPLRKSKGVSGPFIAACAIAMKNGVDPQTIERFVNGFVYGNDLEAGSPILALRNRFSKFNNSAGGDIATEWFGRVARALCDFVNQIKRTKSTTMEIKDAVASLRSLAIPA